MSEHQWFPQPGTTVASYSAIAGSSAVTNNLHWSDRVEDGMMTGVVCPVKSTNRRCILERTAQGRTTLTAWVGKAEFLHSPLAEAITGNVHRSADRRGCCWSRTTSRPSSAPTTRAWKPSLPSAMISASACHSSQLDRRSNPPGRAPPTPRLGARSEVASDQCSWVLPIVAVTGDCIDGYRASTGSCHTGAPGHRPTYDSTIRPPSLDTAQ